MSAAKKRTCAKPPQLTLKEWYIAHVARLRAEGKPLLTYACPCCAQNIDVQRPGADEIWDSMSICPHCDGMHFRVSYGASGRVDTAAVNCK